MRCSKLRSMPIYSLYLVSFLLSLILVTGITFSSSTALADELDDKLKELLLEEKIDSVEALRIAQMVRIDNRSFEDAFAAVTSGETTMDDIEALRQREEAIRLLLNSDDGIDQ